MQTERLRVAIQKKGRLAKECQGLFEYCGIKFNVFNERLIVHAENLPIDLLFVRDDDIPGLVMDGIVDLGIVGENVLEEKRLARVALGASCDYQTLCRLDFGDCRLSLAIDKDKKYQSVKDFSHQRIATTYPHLLKAYLDRHNIPFTICSLNGSVEVAPRAGLADAICDLVSTGLTLEANGLKEVEVIFRSKAVLIQQQGELSGLKTALIDKLLTRIHSVLQAKESKYILLHANKSNLDEIIRLLPGAEAPTILPLAQDENRVALHMVSKEYVFWETMEKLKALGASSILVLPIEKMME